MASDVALEQLSEFVAALARLNLQRAKATGSPITTSFFADQVRAVLLSLRDHEMHAEAFKTGRSFGEYGDQPLRKLNGRRATGFKLPRRTRSLEADLRIRAASLVSVQRPRERRERRTTGVGSGGGDPPDRGDDDDPHDVGLLRPLSANVRAFLKLEVDRRRRAQLVVERDHFRSVPAGGAGRVRLLRRPAEKVAYEIRARRGARAPRGSKPTADVHAREEEQLALDEETLR